jgi:transcriptional regulator with XRE-family HTH domain
VKHAVKPLDKQIGARIRAFRLQRKLSQEQVGEAIGVTFQQIQKYEKGWNRISGSRLVALCELLQVKAEQILGNGSGVFHDEPETLIALQDKQITRIVLALSQLPKARRAAVAQCLLLLVKAFQQPTGKRERDD